METNLVKNDTELIQKALEENKFNERDNDINLLISVLQKKGINPDQISLSQYLRLMVLGDAPWIESVTRIRRMQQTMNPLLYGKTKSVRKGYRVKKVKQEIKEIFDEATGQFSINIQ